MRRVRLELGGCWLVRTARGEVLTLEYVRAYAPCAEHEVVPHKILKNEVTRSFYTAEITVESELWTLTVVGL